MVLPGILPYLALDSRLPATPIRGSLLPDGLIDAKRLYSKCYLFSFYRCQNRLTDLLWAGQGTNSSRYASDGIWGHPGSGVALSGIYF